MRCKKHLTDASSTVGVCASCLRERLFILVAAQIQAQAHAQDDRRKSDSHQLSPYIIRQKSACNHHHRHRQSLKDQLFFSTPQVGPPRRANEEPQTREKESSTRTRFSLFSRFLFRSKPKKADSDLNSVSSSAASTSTGSWFSNMLSGHRKKQSAAEIIRRTGRNRDRGMSPARVSDYGNETDWFDGVSSEYASSSASQSWWQTPRRAETTAKRRGGGGGWLNQSRSTNMTFCLSPLVRASPCRQWNQKGVTPDMAFSGEIRLPVNLSTASAFCANRSRKLADFGRLNHNH